MSAFPVRRTSSVVLSLPETIEKVGRLSSKVILILCIAVFAWPLPAVAKIGTQFQLALGNPTLAGTDPALRTNYLILRPQFGLSYNEYSLQPNWVSWSYSVTDSGSVSRTDAWSVENELPFGFLRVGTSSFGTGWDRGHMTPSADRTATLADNLATFTMSNTIPQASDNNRGVWKIFEDYCRDMAADGDEVLITTGPANFTESRISNGMLIPGSVWKIAVEIPNASSTVPAGQRVTESARVIALLVPNRNGELGVWQNYITSVEKIEDATGFDFFGGIVDASTAVYLKNVVDTGSGPNAPTVVTAFEPEEAAPGTPVTIWGYHFGASPQVWFGDTQAVNVTVNGNHTISAVVPPGTAPGNEFISVNGTGGKDTSYGRIAIRSGTLPFLRLPKSALEGLAALQGKPGTVRSYTISGGNLGGPVTITATGAFEVSGASGAFAPSVTLQPAGGSLAGATLRVRIKSTAPVGINLGTINHSSPGATSASLVVSGTVRSSAPHLVLPEVPLSGFQTLQTRASASRAISFQGFNLTGNLLATAPAGVEISLNNVTFRSSLALPVLNGSLATTLSVRVSRSAAAGALSGNIVFTGGGISPTSFPISGHVGVSGASTAVDWDLTLASAAPDLPVGLFIGNLAKANEAATTSLLSTSSVSTGYINASGGTNAAATARAGDLSLDENGSTYFEFTLAPDPSTTLALSAISFAMRSSATGPQAYSIRSSIDDFATELASGQVAADSTWHLRSHANLGVTSSAPIAFRIYGYNGTSSGSTNWRVDDFQFDVTTTLARLNRPVVISPISASGKTASPFSHQIVATNLAHGFAAIGLPPGLSINATTGLISGKPVRDGIFAVQIQAANVVGTVLQTLSISIAATTPVITSAPAASARQGQAFSYRITAVNAPRTFQATALPAGLTLNATTGFLTGTPSVAGNFTIPISATNPAGTGSGVLQLLILPAPPTLTGPTSANATVGSAFSFQSTATNSPTRFSVSGLPAGLSINATTGLIQGAPALDGIFVVRLGASNAGGSSTREFTLQIAPILPVFTSNSTTIGRIAAPFQFQALAAHAPRGFTATGLPPGLSIHATTGLISGTPTTSGNFTATLSATNPAGTTTQSLALQIRPALPVITSSSTPSGTVGVLFTYQITATNSPTRFGASGIPAGLRFDSTTGRISGYPTTVGAFPIKISAVNAGGTRMANAVLTIQAAANP